MVNGPDGPEDCACIPGPSHAVKVRVATLLTLGYQIFRGWVAANPHAGQAQAESDAQSAR
jgi:hypothetical protein